MKTLGILVLGLQRVCEWHLRKAHGLPAATLDSLSGFGAGRVCASENSRGLGTGSLCWSLYELSSGEVLRVYTWYVCVGKYKHGFVLKRSLEMTLKPRGSLLRLDLLTCGHSLQPPLQLVQLNPVSKRNNHNA